MPGSWAGQDGMSAVLQRLRVEGGRGRGGRARPRSIGPFGRRLRGRRPRPGRRPEVRAWRLQVSVGYGEEGDQAEDDDRQDQGHVPVTPPEPPDDLGLAHPVGERGAERPGGHVGEPEREDRVFQWNRR